MGIWTNQRRKKAILWTGSVTLIAAVLVGACAGYLGDYYRADQDAVSAFAPAHEVASTTYSDGTVVFEPENPEVGFIFYPGGKVEYTAYIPLMEACASEGILCVLVEMPFNLAVLDVNAADGIQELYSEIESWYIGGHSLGGSMAAAYLADHQEAYEGLILLGSYSAADLSGTGLSVLSLYGSEDQVMNREKYESNRSNLPEAFAEVVIDGGCHAYFGMYGPQDGDGTPRITNEEQITFTADAISEFLNREGMALS